MTSIPEFISEACLVFTKSNEYIVTPDILRNAKRGEISESYEEEKYTLVMVLKDIFFDYLNL